MKDNNKVVTALYDSHVHWLMTGEKKSYLNLTKFLSLNEIKADTFDKKNYRGDWLFGFGWDDSQIGDQNPIKVMDQISTNQPICFIKKDAHSCLLNSVAMHKVISTLEANSTLMKFIERDQDKNPNGILKESAFYAIYSQLPPLSKNEIREYLLEAQSYFLNKGFTHIRDMTCSISQWNILKEMQSADELKIYADINFNADTFEQARDQILPFLKSESSQSYKNLKIKGLKIFYDGSLGSKTALLLNAYRGTNNHGNALWDEADVLEIMKSTWLSNFEFSVHTLGDKAVDKIVDLARRLYSEKIRGYLNLEHVELVSADTIVKMKSLYVRCHMQPSHWLSDKKFLNEVLSEQSLKNLFAWEALRKAKVPISFGSDSPIEEPDVGITFEALADSKEFGIEEFKGSFFDFYTHPERRSEPDAPKTYFNGLKPVRIEY